MCTVFLHRRDSQFPFISLLSNRTQAPECHRVFNTICYMAATICNLLCHAARWSCLRSLAFTDQHILATWVGNTTHTHTNPSTCRHAAEAMWRSNPTQYTMQLLPDGGALILLSLFIRKMQCSRTETNIVIICGFDIQADHHHSCEQKNILI